MQTHPKLHILDFMVDTHDFSLATFGPGARTEGVLGHIAKEISEVKKDPDDIEEWTDLIILAFDGAMRQLTQGRGYQPYHAAETILDQWADKTQKNKDRDWPDYRNFSQDQPIEHIRDGEQDAIRQKLEDMGLQVHKIEAVPLGSVGGAVTSSIETRESSDAEDSAEVGALYARMAAANAIQAMMAQREIEAMLEEARSMYDEVMPKPSPEEARFHDLDELFTKTSGLLTSSDDDDDDDDDEYCYEGCPCQQMDEAEAARTVNTETPKDDLPPEIQAIVDGFESMGFDVGVVKLPYSG